ncbi:carbon monoxide dehydrogenase [candidate division NPL-UPA2 bacterium Unc8]|uniref:Carbon monoxide dehydrogenase n=1 Tax=candidate division NPL-UPA2 bacterium Unc8 TaxID=1980939 RepID=A0A399FXN9_UNCN2|nr:Light-independent protochlorophyllide reductase iron-sulfur ATP-binding protein [Bacillota bacterium]MBT9146374.1 Light-independent protochlorophyllide reductase iron-sulfur ATP-binding protein [Bacillota bacterium]RII00179.1 MAG: carbon monoxide dehydrogenase [candidate division NPL-UPA2 bacterium Unc8]
MKLAIAGKGGVGKTTIAALLVNLFQHNDCTVLAIDADPVANLAASLGFPRAQTIVPIIEMKELIEERTGTKAGDIGAYFNLNPHVADIPDKYAVCHNGIKLIVMGGFRSVASGCFCAENAFLKALLSHLLVKRDEVVIVDMEAGVEHLSRGTAVAVDMLLVIVNPGKRSIDTAHKINEVAKSVGIKRIQGIGNRVSSKEDEELITAAMAPIEMLGFVSDSQLVREADIKGKPLLNGDEKIIKEIEAIKLNIKVVCGR